MKMTDRIRYLPRSQNKKAIFGYVPVELKKQMVPILEYHSLTWTDFIRIACEQFIYENIERKLANPGRQKTFSSTPFA